LSLGVANTLIFFLFFFPSDVFFLSFSFPHEANKCFPFIIIYYFARYSCLASIMIKNPCLPGAHVHFKLGQQMLSRFFLNNSNTKMLAPHAVDIAVTNSSLNCHCFTFVEPFDNIFLLVKSSCALVSENTNKSLRPKDGSTGRPNERTRARSLNSYFAFCKIVVKRPSVRLVYPTTSP